jgi:peptidoglycan/xylan/chitin deacetylase (PgdA/CDA1 family)
MRLRLLIAAGCVVGVPILLLAFAPRTLTGAAAAMFPGCRYDVRIAQPIVALTIDDAPDPKTTPAILDTLRAYGSRATFFVITSQLRAVTDTPDPVVTRMLREGHELGNHLTRDRPAIRLDSAAFARDLAEADSVLRPYGPLRWARPGSGWYSRRMVRVMHRAGYECALGSVYPFDAELGWPWLSERYILAHVRPGAVIILHDRGIRGERTAAVLGRVLPALRVRGYRIVPLSELAAAAVGLDR